jgi:hypothetical protein
MKRERTKTTSRETTIRSGLGMFSILASMATVVACGDPQTYQATQDRE